jgi:hypothetical protein
VLTTWTPGWLMVEQAGIRPYVTDTLMRTPDDRRRLAGEVLEFCQSDGLNRHLVGGE